MPQFHSVRAIARQLDCAEMTIYRHVWDGSLPSVRVGKVIRVPDDELRRFLSRREPLAV